MRIALFDIDGTILLAHGAGRRAMERALHESVGSPGPGGQHYAGKTDPQIVREALRHLGFTDAEVDAQLPAVLERYLGGLAMELESSTHDVPAILPGVSALLDACEAHAAITLGLLTGNLLAGAERKLKAAGVDPRRFRFGAFGSDHEDRPTLAALARTRAAEHLRRDIDAAACVVIGDTPADVACGRAIGARTIAVATGNFALADLRACNPDALFEDLSDTAAVLEAILHA